MNEQFLNRMQTYLPDEFEAFEASLDQPLYQGLRLNPVKADAKWLQTQISSLDRPSPFAEDAWYVEGSYGLDPLHLAGAFYLQEPSAGSAVQALQVSESDRVLDLCAAPGSKSTQIAGKLKDGFLIANEIDGKRAQTLLSNIERLGAENMAVTSMDTRTLCAQFSQCFDKILVDAPCSGEGMMKKHAAAKDEWSLDNIMLCQARQKEILGNAHQALAPGGELVYSTCTYACEENEDVAAWFLQEFPDMEQLAIEGSWGRPGFETEGLDASKVRRIFPMDQGEGHFVARFRKKGNPDLQNSLPEQKDAKLPAQAQAFLSEQLEQPYDHYLLKNARDRIQVFGMNHPFVKFKKGQVLRQGVYLGDLIKNRFEPAHAFFLSRSMLQGMQKTETNLQEMDAFVHGEQLSLQAPKGWRALTYQGIPYGFGKSDGTRITNKYPKGLRLKPGSHVQLHQSPVPHNPQTGSKNEQQGK